jgi:hypothetical protein
VFAPSFRVHVKGKVVPFRPKRSSCGYYLVAPGKKPHVVEGVQTDTDIYFEVRKYFGIVIPES